TLQFLGHPAQQAEGGAHWGGAEADSRHAQLLQLRYRRRPWPGENIYRMLQINDEAPDRFRVANTGNKQAIRTRVTKCRQSLESQFVTAFWRSHLEKVNIGSCIQHNRHSGSSRLLEDSVDFFNLQGQVQQWIFRLAGGVLQIHSHGAGLDDRPRSERRVFWTIAISGLDIGCNRNLNRGCDALNRCQHFLAGDMLAIGIPQSERDSRAGRGDCAETAALENAGTSHLPGIWEQQQPSSMHVAKRFSSRFLLCDARHSIPRPSFHPRSSWLAHPF